MFASRRHHADCARKQQELLHKRSTLPPIYSEPLTDGDQKILSLSLSQVVSECNAYTISPEAVLHAYGKRALLAQDATNCLADVMIDEADRDILLQKPLSGVVISIKDCINVAGHDTTLGFSSRTGRPVETSAPLVRLLHDAGALLHVKTTVPTGLLSFETESDVFGATLNPYNPAFSPGGSTGGGAALVAYQGSIIEVGTDVGGSTRFPAAYCGVYSMKSSVGRFPADGCVPCMSGQEASPTVTSPVARTLDDLREFWKRVVEMQPWLYDHTCVPLPWRPVDFILSGRKPKWGVIWSDGIIPPSPACRRALQETVDSLKRVGHEVVDFSPPPTLEGLIAGYQLLFGDGGVALHASRRSGETMNGAQRTVQMLLSLPLWVKRFLASMYRLLSRPEGRNDAWASLLESFHPRTIAEEREQVVAREAFKAAWHEAWQDQGVDFVLIVPHAIPPVPRGGTGTATLVSASYCFLFNILDYCAGVVPVTYVDQTLDRLPANFKQGNEYQNMNDIARGVYSLYDASAMHGLPVAVQVVGQRLEEEKVLAGMAEVERALWDAGRGFVARKF
ncbi:amidase signature enzyme [Fomitopsis serialis]|uniref:amidase signature enzyme n=1 Tax=Fomitopsis serialis TaxID=139415 RepID=UPI002008DAA8|nr:amidase signature enzyme [Neoantrodia serialis]KAH9926713.1 amidase signature enzyme [Neoantrodia serialis]